MFKKLKVELFLLKRLFSQHYPPRDYFNYFRYRILGDFYLSQFSKQICIPDPDFEVHVLCQKKDANMLEWALKSFLYFSQLCPTIIIHDDGSFDAESVAILEGKFTNLKVLFKSEADRLVKNYPGLTNEARAYRDNGHIMIMEFFDLFLMSNKAKKVMIFDSDILFFKKPTEIIDFINGKSSFDALISRQFGTYDLVVDKKYEVKHKLIEKEVGFMNPGLILLNRDKLTLNMFVEYFQNTKRNVKDYFLGMSGWGSLVSQINFDFFPADAYTIKYRPNEYTIMKHFTSPRRYDFYAYGIDLVRKNLKV